MEDLTDGVQPREDKPRQDTHKAGTQQYGRPTKEKKVEG